MRTMGWVRALGLAIAVLLVLYVPLWIASATGILDPSVGGPLFALAFLVAIGVGAAASRPGGLSS